MILILIGPTSNAEDYSCLQPPDTFGTEPIWKTSANKDLKYVVSWAFKDPEKCIVDASDLVVGYSNFSFQSYRIPATWTITRAGEMALVSAETEFPVTLLKALPRVDNQTSQTNFLQTNKAFQVATDIKIKRAGSYAEVRIFGSYGLAQLWADWFSKNQGIYPTDCKPVDLTSQKSDISVDWKILESGLSPKIEISVEEENNCILLIHAGPLEPLTNVVNFYKYEKSVAQSQFSFDEGPGSLYFNSILSNPDKFIQIGMGEFASEVPERLEFYHFDELRSKIDRIPSKVLNHSDSVLVQDNSIKIRSVIDGSSIDPSVKDYVTVYLGIYHWSYESSKFVSSGWNVTYSGSTWTARYNKGSSIPGGNYFKYSTRAIKIPVSDLFLSTEAKAAAELKAKLEANAKAAELKAKQEEEAKAKAAAERAASDLVVKLALEKENANIAKQKEIDKGLEKLKINLKGLASKYPSFKRDVYLLKYLDEINSWNWATMKGDYQRLEYAYLRYNVLSADVELFLARSKASLKTITCVKGKVVKKVTEVDPFCPKGYKKKA
jgi:hypothetical protein